MGGSGDSRSLGGDPVEDAVDETFEDPAGRWAGSNPPGPPAAFAEYVTRAQWRPLAVVLFAAVFSIGMALVNFRLGAVLLAGTVILAFTERLLLTDEAAGLLAVRSRKVDLVILGIMAVGTTVLAIGVPATFTPSP